MIMFGSSPFKSHIMHVDAFLEEFKKLMTVSDWITWGKIKEDDMLKHPNARTAYEIKSSPLGKVLE